MQQRMIVCHKYIFWQGSVANGSGVAEVERSGDLKR